MCPAPLKDCQTILHLLHSLLSPFLRWKKEKSKKRLFLETRSTMTTTAWLATFAHDLKTRFHARYFHRKSRSRVGHHTTILLSQFREHFHYGQTLNETSAKSKQTQIAQKPDMTQNARFCAQHFHLKSESWGGHRVPSFCFSLCITYEHD